MKGVILAGGSGSRLYPLTRVTNKHLLPIYDKPMIYYPLKTLIDAGIDDILVVAGRGHAGDFLELLGSGKEFGVKLSYSVQEARPGIAGALELAQHFNDGESMAVILGDNIFEEKFDFTDFEKGARVYLKRIAGPERFGVAEIRDGRVASIVEKPDKPKTSLAVTGLYLYDESVFEKIGCLKPSGRGELEITDVNNAYIGERLLDYRMVDGYWTDAGTFRTLLNANNLIAEKQGE